MANPPTEGNMGLTKFSKYHALKNEVRVIIQSFDRFRRTFNRSYGIL